MINQKFNTFVKHNGKLVYDEYDPKFIIAGDTDSAYLDLSSFFPAGSDVDGAIPFADRIGELVNDSFKDFLYDAFNVNDDKHKNISTEREAVSDKSIFFGKKKYIMHVVDMEGKKVDKMKLMGVEIIKSDTPIIIQKFLQNVVDLLLEHEPYDVIDEYVSSFKKEYYAMDFTKIGVPKNIKVYKKYFARYEEQLALCKVIVNPFGTDGENTLDSNPFRALPQHAKASIVYNQTSDAGDIKIRGGDKIKIVYIKDTDVNVVAVPADSEPWQLPKFITEIEIDYDMMWSKVEQKLDLYLVPIGYDLKSRKAKHTEAFFGVSKGTKKKRRASKGDSTEHCTFLHRKYE